MLPSWVYLAFISEIFWVGGNLFDKYLLEHYFGDEEDDGGPGALLIFSAYFAIVFVVLLLIFGYSKIEFGLLTGLFGLFLGLLNGIWIFFYLLALDRAELSQAVPIFQTIPIFGLLFSFLFLGEVISLGQAVSAGIIIVGALVLLANRKSGVLKLDYTTLFLMLIASLIVALTETLFKVVALDFNYWTAAFWMSSGFALLGVTLHMSETKFTREFNSLIHNKKKHILSANSINEVLDNVAELVFLSAIVLGPVALVQSLNAYQPLLILVASIIMTKFVPAYFDEDLSKTSLLQKLLGVIVITIGSFYLYGAL